VIAIRLVDVPRLAKTTQTALDELDRPCPAASIEGLFMPNARIVLGHIPGPCYESIARVAFALARGNGEIPTGYGAACVRHFSKRSKQLEPILHVSIERRFELIELAVLAGIEGRWTDPSVLHKTSASHKECVRLVAQLPSTSGADAERWRPVIGFLLTSPQSNATTHRNLAYALVWCGYFAPHELDSTDERLAWDFFGAKREEFVRARQEALRWLPQLLEFSQQTPTGGPS
jgi:hypothetical protein